MGREKPRGLYGAQMFRRGEDEKLRYSGHGQTPLFPGGGDAIMFRTRTGAGTPFLPVYAVSTGDRIK